MLKLLKSLNITSSEEEEQRRIEQDYEVQRQLKGPLLEVSRQRLRAIKMGMRKYSNVDSRITAKELQLIFQVILVSHLLWRHMSVTAPQITGKSTICLTACSAWQKRRHQNSELLALC